MPQASAPMRVCGGPVGTRRLLHFAAAPHPIPRAAAPVAGVPLDANCWQYGRWRSFAQEGNVLLLHLCKPELGCSIRCIMMARG